MISLNELKRIAAKQRIALSVVEKDYALTWVLYGLSQTEFKKYFVFFIRQRINFPSNFAKQTESPINFYNI